MNKIQGEAMSDTTITVRVSQEMKDRLEAIGSSYKRSKSFLASEALKRYIQNEEAYLEGIREARADLSEGRHYTNQQVFEQIDEAISKIELTHTRS